MSPEKLVQQLPWVEKYRPKVPTEMVGVDKIADTLRRYVKNGTIVGKDGKKKKAVMLRGPPGIGKTTIVYAVARELKLNVVEANASDVRNTESLKRKVAESAQSKDIFDFVKKRTVGKIVLMDEVDGISGQAERGGVATLVEIIKTSEFPVVMTSNEYDQKLKPLYDVCLTINCNRLLPASIKNVLKRIAAAENLKISDEVIISLASNSNGDLRSAINDLQSMAQGTGVFNVVDEHGMSRDTTESVLNAINALFKTTTLAGAKDALDNLDVDYSMLHRWVIESLPAFLRDATDLADAYSNAAVADSYLSKIGQYQDYGLLAYFYDVISGGVALSAKRDMPPTNFVRVDFPRMPTGKIEKAKLPAIAKMQQKMHVPQDVVVKYVLHLLSALISYSPDSRAEIVKWFELTKQEEKVVP